VRCHPPYSPNLAPSDFHLFRLLKNSLRGQVFQSDEVVIQAINEWLEEHEQRFFLEGVKALEHRWEKCVALRGDNVEKCEKM
jgi:histone-lysine N-methyltransferase SETMAR